MKQGAESGPGLGSWTIAGSVVLTAALLVWVHAIDGAFVRRMALHIVLMSLLAPLVVLALAGRRARRVAGRPTLALATIAQLTVLYLWHLPAPHALATDSWQASLLMHASLGLVAVWFWHAVLIRKADSVWPAVAALLATGKLFCLLGVLYLLARRPLFVADELLVSLEEQQLAGLLMLIACPLTYLGAAFVITCRAIAKAAGAPGPPVLSP